MGEIEKTGGRGLTIRSALIAVFMTLFLLASSSYIAIKIGALPWPIVFSVVVCGGILSILSIFRKTNLHEINVAQAGSSIGGLMASALVFVIPGIWYLQKSGIDIPDISNWKLIVICVAGGILGVLLSIPLRKHFIDKEKLAYPSGVAGAETLRSVGKGSLGLLMFVGALAGMFALTRDIYFASGFSLSFLAAYGIFFTIYPMPLAIGVGYILGKKNSYSWFIGAVVGWIIIIPLLVMNGIESSNAISMIQNIGMGIVLGSGVGFIFMYVLPRIKRIFGPVFEKKSAWYLRSTPYVSIAIIPILYFTGVPLLASIISVVCVRLIAAVAARMTGETNIDPLEQFGIVVGLVCLLIYSILGSELGYIPAFLIVLFVSVVAAIAGDIGHDFKSAKIIGTRVYDIIRVDLIAVVVAGITGPFVLEVIRRGFFDVMFTEVMAAPQAQMVAGSITGFPYPYLFLIGFGVAMFIEMFRKKMNVPMMPFGIGMFLGMGLSLMLFLGGLLKHIFGNKKVDKKMVIGSAGLMGGEGIAGFIVAALFVFGIFTFKQAANGMFILLFIAGIIGLYLMRKKR